ncbi:MAG: ribosome maturation factor RimP [Candidatus Omnitrophica bacterium]|nr:ribosome maturation factor RimP [Candidatus Omnitrophota bacterium]MDD5574153.1 ribosome maturation factor RimP [Candidatus Omnitrophota bacterium]
MMSHELLLRIRPFFEDRMAPAGYVLVDMRFYKRQGGAAVLEVLADRDEGGITLDECSRLNRELGDVLEKEGFLSQAYVLDVSSPGLDRSLTTAGDFRRARGRTVRFFLKDLVEGKFEHCGTVEDISDDTVTVRVTDKKGERTIAISLGNINKAKQVVGPANKQDR